MHVIEYSVIQMNGLFYMQKHKWISNTLLLVKEDINKRVYAVSFYFYEILESSKL